MGKRSRTARVLVVLLASASVVSVAGSTARAAPLAPAVGTQRPNVLLLVSDDQSWSTFNRTLMPAVYGRLVDQGVLFDRAYDATTLCCPSRSEIMTGLYEHHTGVDTNQTTLIHPTIVAALHDAGYRTAMAGKYLNSWPCAPRAEFDDWLCMGNGQSTYTLKNPMLNSNGTWQRYAGYSTDILADRLVSFVNSVPTDTPFFAMYTPTSPHLPADDDRCYGLPVSQWRPPSYDEATLGGTKPSYVRRPALGPTERAAIDQDFTRMTQAVSCLDGSIKRILDGLGSRADNTLIVYLSDNGFLFGEHRREGKMVPYEEAARVPFIVRYPPWVSPTAPFQSDALVQNVDVTPTIAEAAGLAWGADGLSLVPLVKRQVTSIRTQALLEGCHGGGTDQCIPYTLQSARSTSPPFSAVVTSQYKYVKYDTGELELYDLLGDPNELTNHAGEPAYGAIQSDLAGRLASLTAPSPVQTTIYSGPTGLLSTRVATFKYFSLSRYSTYSCRLDVNGKAGKWSPCNFGSVTLGPLAAGNYTFRVVGKDEYGQTDSTPDSRSFQIQDSGPAVSITSAPPARTTTATLSFSFSSPVSGVTYECAMSQLGIPDAWAPCTSAAVYGPLGDGPWSFRVRAVDGLGIATSPPAQKLVTVDHSGPTVVWKRGPAPVTQSTAAHFIFTPTEPIKGDLGCNVDGGASVKCTTGVLDLASLVPGPHKLVVTGTDTVGNKRNNVFQWTIDRTAPTVSVSGPAPYTKSRFATIGWTPSEPLMDPTTENLGRGCSLDGVPVSAGLCGSPATFSNLADGLHTFVLQVVDAAYNVSAPVQFQWTVDTVKPVATIQAAPPTITSSSSATFAFSGADQSPVTFTCSVDGAAPTSCVSGVAYQALADGGHSFTLTPTDAAGNVGTPVTSSWTVDATAPVVSILSGPPSPTSDTSASFAFGVDDATAVTLTCALDGAAATACQTPLGYAGLGAGDHTLSVIGTDAAGNVSEPATWSWTITT